MEPDTTVTALYERQQDVTDFVKYYQSYKGYNWFSKSVDHVSDNFVFVTGDMNARFKNAGSKHVSSGVHVDVYYRNFGRLERRSDAVRSKFEDLGFREAGRKYFLPTYPIKKINDVNCHVEYESEKGNKNIRTPAYTECSVFRDPNENYVFEKYNADFNSVYNHSDHVPLFTHFSLNMTV